MLSLARRAPEVTATQFIYPSQRDYLAEQFGGVVDTVTGELYVQTGEGIRPVPYGHWIVRDEARVTIRTEAEVTAAYEPIDPVAAYNMLGSRSWPGTPKEG